ncbi:MarR family winged helix-turn-helix transcriptional regulator [Arthrobacter pigmenti]
MAVMTEGPGGQLYELLRHVRPLHLWSAKVVADALEDRGMTVAMRAVIEQVYDSGAQTVPQVARSLWLARQGVQRSVDDAVQQGLLRLVDNPAHRRSSLIELTGAGRNAFEEIHRDEIDVLAGVAETLDPDDVDTAVRVMATLADAVRRQAQKGQPGKGGATPGP